MRTLSLAIALPLFFFACGDKSESSEDTDGWFGQDEGTDDYTAVSGGEEGGEEGGSTGEGTEHPDPYAALDCDDGLSFQAQSRDDGGFCTKCEGHVELYGVVYNPCEEPLSFRTTSSMLVGSMSLTGPWGDDGMGDGGGGGEPLDIELNGGESYEEYLTGGPYPNGVWRLEVRFSDTEGHEDSHNFEMVNGGGTGSGTGGGTGAADTTTGGDDEGDGDDAAGTDGGGGGSSSDGGGSGSADGSTGG